MDIKRKALKFKNLLFCVEMTTKRAKKVTHAEYKASKKLKSCKQAEECVQKYEEQMNPLIKEMHDLSRSYSDILDNSKYVAQNPFKSVIKGTDYAKICFIEASEAYALNKKHLGDSKIKDANLYAKNKIGWTLPDGTHTGCYGATMDMESVLNDLKSYQKSSQQIK